MIFGSDPITSENHKLIASRVIKNRYPQEVTLCFVSDMLLCVLNTRNQTQISSFAVITKDGQLIYLISDSAMKYAIGFVQKTACKK